MADKTEKKKKGFFARRERRFWPLSQIFRVTRSEVKRGRVAK